MSFITSSVTKVRNVWQQRRIVDPEKHPLIHYSAFYGRSLAAYPLSLFPVKEKTRFVIFAQGRSGSTLLCDLLDSHSKIWCDGELLRRHRWAPERFITGMMQTSTEPVFGFKCKIYQLQRNDAIESPRSFLQSFCSRGWKLIYLWRSNVVRQAVSSMIAKQKKMYFADQRKREDLLSIRVPLDVDELEEQINRRLAWLSEEEEIVSELPHCKVNYERDLFESKKWPATASRVFNFLGLENAEIKTNLSRTSTNDLSQMVENYEEVRETVRRLELAHMLD